MKKFLKLCLAVAALATMFGDSTANSGAGTGTGTAETAKTITELNYTDAELAGKIFTYEDDEDTVFVLFYNGNCYTVDDKSKFDNLSILQGNSPSILKFNDKIYKYAKYTRQSGEGLYTTWENDSGAMIFTATGNGSFALKGQIMAFTFTNDKGNLTLTAPGMGVTKAYYDGTNIYVLNHELTFVENYTPAATNNVFKGKVFVDEAQIFAFKSDGKVLWAQKNATFKELTYTVSSDTCTTDKFTGSINGTTFTAGDGNPKHTGSFTQITGDNEFGGKAFYTTTPIKAFIVFTTNNNVMIAMEGEREFETENR